MDCFSGALSIHCNQAPDFTDSSSLDTPAQGLICRDQSYWALTVHAGESLSLLLLDVEALALSSLYLETSKFAEGL